MIKFRIKIRQVLMVAIVAEIMALAILTSNHVRKLHRLHLLTVKAVKVTLEKIDKDKKDKKDKLDKMDWIYVAPPVDSLVQVPKKKVKNKFEVLIVRPEKPRTKDKPTELSHPELVAKIEPIPRIPVHSSVPVLKAPVLKTTQATLLTTDKIVCLAFNGNDYLTSSGWNSGIRLWGLQQNGQLDMITERKGNQVCTTSRTYIAVEDSENCVFLYNKHARHILKVFIGKPMPQSTLHLQSLSLSPDESLLAMVYDSKTIRIWNLNGTTYQDLNLKSRVSQVSQVTNMSFSPDSKYLAIGTGISIDIWNLNKGKITTRLQAKDVYVLSFAPGGKVLASGFNNIIRLWNLETGKQTNEFRYEYRVYSLAFNSSPSSPSSPTCELISGNEGGVTKIWKVPC